MEKIPCIKCNSLLWDYIKPYLEKWGYKESIIFTNDWDYYSYLVLNHNAKFGIYCNVGDSVITHYNRELIDNIEEFLERAAKLKDFVFIKENKIQINGIEIKPGMVISTSSETFWIVFPIKNELAVISYYSSSWYLLKDFIKFFKEDIKVIYDLAIEDSITSGTILWEKSKEVIITKEQVAEKFNVPIKYLKIV